MRRCGVVVLIAIIVGVIVFLAMRIVDATADSREQHKTATAEIFDGIVTEVTSDGTCEVVVDLGRVPYSLTATKVIRFVNASNEPLLLLDHTTQCRCMWLEFDREPINAGDSRDVTLYFDSRGEWGSVGNYMELITSRESSPIVLWIGAEIE